MVSARTAGCRACLHWLTTKTMGRVHDEMNHFCFPRSDKRGPLALTGCKAAKVEWVLRAPFVWQRPHLSDTNAALAVLAARATVTNLFGLDNHQFTAVTRPSSQAARATLWIHSQWTCTRALVTSGFKFWQSAINFDDFAPLWVEGSQGPWPASGLNDFWRDFLGSRSNHYWCWKWRGLAGFLLGGCSGSLGIVHMAAIATAFALYVVREREKGGGLLTEFDRRIHY